MGLTLRSEAGMALTINQMDNNLLYLEGLTNYKEVYYNELKSLYDGKDMEVGWYLITDFQTIYDLPDYEDDGDGNIQPKSEILTMTSSVVEPIFVRALSEAQLSPISYSSQYPGDILHYDINYTTPINESTTKGLIYYREDTIQNVKVSYDFRNVTFKRYDHNDDRGYIYYWDNGDTGSQLFNTFIDYEGVGDFDLLTNMNTIKGISVFDMSNNVFKGSSNIKIINNLLINNTFLDDVALFNNNAFFNSIFNSLNLINGNDFDMCFLEKLDNINNSIFFNLTSSTILSNISYTQLSNLNISGNSGNSTFNRNIFNTGINGVNITEGSYSQLFSPTSCEIFRNSNGEIWYKYYDNDNELQFVQIN
jgi:hypothetical protein